MLCVVREPTYCFDRSCSPYLLLIIIVHCYWRFLCFQRFSPKLFFSYDMWQWSVSPRSNFARVQGFCKLVILVKPLLCSLYVSAFVNQLSACVVEPITLPVCRQTTLKFTILVFNSDLKTNKSWYFGEKEYCSPFCASVTLLRIPLGFCRTLPSPPSRSIPRLRLCREKDCPLRTYPWKQTDAASLTGFHVQTTWKSCDAIKDRFNERSWQRSLSVAKIVFKSEKNMTTIHGENENWCPGYQQIHETFSRQSINSKWFLFTAEHECEICSVLLVRQVAGQQPKPRNGCPGGNWVWPCEGESGRSLSGFALQQAWYVEVLSEYCSAEIEK